MPINSKWPTYLLAAQKILLRKYFIFKKATHINQIYIYLMLLFHLLKKWIWASKTVSKNFNSTTCTQCTLTKPLEKSCATLSENFVKESFLRGEFFYIPIHTHQYILCILYKLYSFDLFSYFYKKGFSQKRTILLWILVHIRYKYLNSPCSVSSYY